MYITVQGFFLHFIESFQTNIMWCFFGFIHLYISVLGSLTMCILQEMRENCKNFLSLCVLKDGCMHVFVRFVRFFLFFKKKKIFSFDLFANYEIDGKWENWGRCGFWTGGWVWCTLIIQEWRNWLNIVSPIDSFDDFFICMNCR